MLDGDLISAFIGKVCFFFSGGQGGPAWYYVHLYPLSFKFTVATDLPHPCPESCPLAAALLSPSTPGGTLEGVAGWLPSFSHGTPVT